MSTISQVFTHEQNYVVEQYRGQIAVVAKQDAWQEPPAGYVAVQILSAGICGADIRVCTGQKQFKGADQPITLGHEGCGVITALGAGVHTLALGDCVVVLPHMFPADHASYCPAPRVCPACIGAGHTLHRGWDIPGVFADRIMVPTDHLARVDPVHLKRARLLAPELMEGVFAWSEPMLCVLSAYQLLEEQMRSLMLRNLGPGRALVMGCGPIGALHALMLLERGFDVWLFDEVAERAGLVQRCLGKGYLFDPFSPGRYELVVIAASSVSAIRMGEALVADRGALYVFAGLNADEREEMDIHHTFYYERIHRAALGVLTMTQGKRVLYVGHSGYYEELAEEAIAFVAEHAAPLSRFVTGVIPGWNSPRIESALPDGAFVTPDGSPIILRVLRGADVRSTHGKLLVLPSPLQ
jgi:threonine dehydrogenase-like Zn-dependent dehydrogenase